MGAEWQAPPESDVILRASGGKELHAHKLILSIASPVFRDMFSIPQPPTESSQLPIVDVDEPPEALEVFLRIIYPISNPPIDDIEKWAPVLRLADKYDAGVVIDVHREYLLSMRLDSPPIHTYAILCFCGREKEAEAVARRVSFASLASLHSHPLFCLVTLEHYKRLVGFLVARDKRTREIVSKRRAELQKKLPGCVSDAHELYCGIIASSIQAAFEENPCVQVVEALGIVTSAPLTFSPCRLLCVFNVRGLRERAEGLLKELVEMAESLPWGDRHIRGISDIVLGKPRNT